MRYTLLCLICSLLTIWIPVQTTTAQPSVDVLVFAASSLVNVFTDLSIEYESHHNTQITLNFAGSSTLSAQLQQGAPADIFASANRQQMQSVVDDELIADNDIALFAENELVIIVPSDNPAEIQSALDLTRRGILLALAAPSVPIRDYTDELLDNLSIEFGDNFVDNVYQNVVSEESNVRQIVARIALGEADAGIVYRTDVTPDLVDDVTIIDLPQGTSPRAEYLIAPLLDAPNYKEAEAFIEFILSDEGRAILHAWGFCSPDNLLPERTPDPETTPEVETPSDAETHC